MKTFDSYTQNIICSFLTEQSVPPKPSTKKKIPFKVKDPNDLGGYDPYQQLTWWNYAQTLENELAGMTAGTFGGAVGGGAQAIGNVMQGIGNLTGVGAVSAGGQALSAAGGAAVPLLTRLGKPAEYAIKQAIRTALGKAYLGAEVDPVAAFGKELDKYNLNIPPELKNYYDEMKGYIGSVLDPANLGFEPGLFAADRFGDIGKSEAEKLSRLAFAGENPLTLAMQAFGAENAAETVKRAYTTNPAFAETAGGFLQKGKQLGIYK